jgi:hypothetical protein
MTNTLPDSNRELTVQEKVDAMARAGQGWEDIVVELRVPRAVADDAIRRYYDQWHRQYVGGRHE